MNNVMNYTYYLRL